MNKFIPILFLAGLLCLLPLPVLAQGTYPSGGQSIVLPRDEVVNKDYFAAANNVTVSGIINGDAYVAGSNVVIDGTVNGDVLAAGGTVRISGRVVHDIRVAGGAVTVDGFVGGNITSLGRTIDITRSSTVSGSLVAAGGNLNLGAPLGKGATLAGENLLIQNTVNGDIAATGSTLTLSPTAKVNGNIDFWSNNQVALEQGATVSGAVRTHIPPQPARPNQAAARGVLTTAWLIFNLLSLIAAIIVGLVLLRFLPGFTQTVMDTLERQPLESGAIGLLALFLTPFICLLLLITIVGIPLAGIIFGLYLIALYLSNILVALFAGHQLLIAIGQKPSTFVSLVVGLVVLTILKVIPILGGIISLLVVIVGLGGMLVAGRNRYYAPQTTPPPEWKK